MLIQSKITGKKYNPEHVWYISNMQQVSAQFANGGDIYLLDVIYNSSKNRNKMVFVYEKNDFMIDLYDRWCKYELEH